MVNFLLADLSSVFGETKIKSQKKKEVEVQV